MTFLPKHIFPFSIALMIHIPCTLLTQNESRNYFQFKFAFRALAIRLRRARSSISDWKFCFLLPFHLEKSDFRVSFVFLLFSLCVILLFYQFLLQKKFCLEVTIIQLLVYSTISHLAKKKWLIHHVLCFKIFLLFVFCDIYSLRSKLFTQNSWNKTI